MHYPIIVVGAFALLAGGCAKPLARNDSPAPGHDMLPAAPVLTVEEENAVVPVIVETDRTATGNEDIWSAIRDGYELTDVQHPRIDHEIRRAISHRAAFDRLMTRATPFLYYILSEIQARNMPTEIVLLPAVESGFRPQARSSKGASGLWQFMPQTGKIYNLQQDWWSDCRRDAIASTNAALDYLEYLHDRFDGDWLLALAAYNAGEGKVRRAVRKNRMKGRPSDFFSLRLPRETRHYVPRLLALSRIVQAPERYQVSLPDIENSQYFTVVETGSQIDLQVAAELAEVTPEILLALNSSYKRAATHPDGPHRLLLPVAAARRFEQRLAALPDDQRLRQKRHRIRSGETLSHIAMRYNVSVTAIKRANGLTSNRILSGDYLLIPLSGTTLASRDSDKPAINYRVREGDSLSRIAQRFAVKISDLKSWNQLQGKYIKPGQELIVHTGNRDRTL